eukprot:16435947-Heterocapsa_arctica.AAC.1
MSCCSCGKLRCACAVRAANVFMREKVSTRNGSQRGRDCLLSATNFPRGRRRRKPESNKDAQAPYGPTSQITVGVANVDALLPSG